MRTLITNARLIDGSGAPARAGELLVEDEHIAEVGEASLPADEVLDAGGLVLAPGFIDMHTHSDFTLSGDPLAPAKLLQGVTTEVVGNCGLGLTPANDRVQEMYEHMAPVIFGATSEKCSPTLAAYRDHLHRIGISLNAACLIPHGNLRCAAMGLAERDASPQEIGEMRELAEQGMEEGAFGISTGLVYPPGAYAKTEELILVTKAIASHEGLYASHIRNEANHLVEAVKEAMEIGEQAGVPVQLSHHKAGGRLNWGKVKRSLALVEQARRRGQAVDTDVYPYTAGSTILASLTIPLWAFEGGHEDTLARLMDPPTRERMAVEFRERLSNMIELPGPLKRLPMRFLFPLVVRKMSQQVVVSSVRRQHHYEGKTLHQLTKIRGQKVYDMILDLLYEEDLAVAAIAHLMCEEDVRTVLRHEATMIGSDSFPLSGGKPHPRTFGTFARILGHYVREEDFFSLEEAVHRMTGKSADKLGLQDRGRLQVGAKADLVLFDPAEVKDHATYETPTATPTGIPHVFVAGQWTVKDGSHTGQRAGRVLDKKRDRA